MAEQIFLKHGNEERNDEHRNQPRVQRGLYRDESDVLRIYR